MEIFYLVYAGKILDSKKTLKECGIANTSTIQIRIRTGKSIGIKK